MLANKLIAERDAVLRVLGCVALGIVLLLEWKGPWRRYLVAWLMAVEWLLLIIGG